MYSAFLEMFKKRKKEIKYTKYFIPCYDVLINEIYFTEFFTDEIITKPIIKKTNDNHPRSPHINMHINSLNNDKLNFSTLLKESLNSSSKKEKSNTKIPELDTEQYLKEKEEKILLEELQVRWQKIIHISLFNTDNYISTYFYNYFSRPFFSHFLRSQNLQLYSYNSTLPISNSISSYSFVDVYIDFHLDSLLDTKFEEKQDDSDEDSDDEINIKENDVCFILNKIKKDLNFLFKQSKKISLFYVVDTLIKDSEKLLEDNLNYLLNKSLTGDIITTTEEVETSSNFLKETEGEYEKKIKELLQKLKDVKSDKSKKMVLKVIGYEEYLYGESNLSNYYFIRNKVRQKELVKLILKVVPSYILNPPIFSYPPIIKIDKNKDVNYSDLMELYKKYYPKHEIIFRLYKTTKKQIERYSKKNLERTKFLTKFTESGDCEFPLIININSVNNIFNFVEWFNNEDYCKHHNSQLIFDYFNPLKKITVKKTTKFEKLFSYLRKSFSKKEEEENQKKVYGEVDDSFFEKMIKKGDLSKKENKEIEKKLNYLDHNLYYQKETYNSFNNILSNITNFQFGLNNALENLLDRTISTENKNKIKDIKFSQHDHIINKYDNFILQNHPTDLITPVYIRVKIYLLYGSYCFQQFSTEPFLIKNFIKINNKIIFNDKDNNTLISHLPLETRIAIRIKGYDQKLNKGFVLGCCQIPLFKENGQMQNGVVEYDLWPNVKIYPRANVSTPFSRKFVSEEEIEEYYEKIGIEISKMQMKIISNLKTLSTNSKKSLKSSRKASTNEQDKINDKLDAANHIFEKININKIPPYFWEMIRFQRQEKKFKEKKKNFSKEKHMKNLAENTYDTSPKNSGIPKSRKSTFFKSINFKSQDSNLCKPDNYSIYVENPYKKIEQLNKKNNNPSITIQFPKFASPLIHSVTNIKNYRKFLDIKYKDQKKNFEDNDYYEIRKLFGNSQKEIKEIISDFKKNTLSKQSKNLNSENNYNKNRQKYSMINSNSSQNKEDKYPSNIWTFLEKTFHSIVHILKRSFRKIRRRNNFNFNM